MPNCWVEIDLRAIANNFCALQTLIGEEKTLIAVLKANAYGHGAVEVARTLENAGAKYLAVTRLEEALPLREAGITAPILLLAPALPDEADALLPHRLTTTLSCFDDAKRLSQAAVKQGATARAQLKIDTGMGRFGVMPSEALEVAQRIAALPGIELESAWTHFATAAGDVRQSAQVAKQFSQFQTLVQELSQTLSIPLQNFHCANSAATLRFPEMRLSCVRIGTLLYGQFPSKLASDAGRSQGLQLEDTFQAKTRILAIKEIATGQSVGYGSEWTAKKTSRIATVGIGFADGFAVEPQTRSATFSQIVQQALRQTAAQFGKRRQSGMRMVSIGEKKTPIVGRIGMQSCAVDITELAGINVGDEVSVALRRTCAKVPLVFKR